MHYYNDFTKNLLDLKDVIIHDVKHENGFCFIHISLPAKTHKYPRCGQLTRSAHNYRKQLVKNIPLLNKSLLLINRNRRYKCNNCNKRFYETADFIGRYQRMTKRLIETVIEKMRSNYSMKSIAKVLNIIDNRSFDHLFK